MLIMTISLNEIMPFILIYLGTGVLCAYGDWQADKAHYESYKEVYEAFGLDAEPIPYFLLFSTFIFGPTVIFFSKQMREDIYYGWSL